MNLMQNRRNLGDRQTSFLCEPILTLDAVETRHKCQDESRPKKQKDAHDERGVFLRRQEMRGLRFSLADVRAWGNGGIGGKL